MMGLENRSADQLSSADSTDHQHRPLWHPASNRSPSRFN